MLKTQITINSLFPKLLVNLILGIGLSLFFTLSVEAATLSISPASSTISVGNITAVKVLINTEGKYINNSDAIIQFPTDMLEVVSINKNPSIFSMWVEEPVFSNLTGQVSFNGGIANPGFSGANGTIATITFKAKKQGFASIIFQEGAIRANDGFGTDIIEAKNSGSIQIGLSQNIEVPPNQNDQNAVPSKPVISSDTHPDQDLWYSSTSASFSWKIPTGVTSLQTLFNDNPISTPSITYDNSVTRKTLNNLNDGISYFHLRYFNLTGSSPSAHYRIKTDSTSPLEFTPTIHFVNNQGLLKLNAEDATSGIDYYTIQIDTEPILIVKKETLVNGEYSLPVQAKGSHDVIVIAYDRAGNKRQALLSFVAPTVSIPVITLSSYEITSGENVTIMGKTDYPNRQIEVTLETKGKELKKYTQTTSNDGTFSINTDKIKTVGSISIYAETIFSETIKSEPSEKIYLKINETKTVRITLAVLYPLIGLILIVALSLVLVFLFYLGWHKYFGLKKKIKDDSRETVSDIHKAMLLLKEELEGQLKALEKVKRDRNLNDKEEEIFGEIKKNIDDIDIFIEKKLRKLM